MAGNRKRIMITVSDEMAKRIEMYSEKMGVTQSSLCAQFVGQAIMTFDKTYDVLQNSMQSIVDEGKKQIASKSADDGEVQ